MQFQAKIFAYGEEVKNIQPRFTGHLMYHLLQSRCPGTKAYIPRPTILTAFILKANNSHIFKFNMKT